MRAFALIAALLGMATAAPSAKDVRGSKGYTVAHGGSKVIVSKDNTLNGTKKHDTAFKVNAATGSLPLNFVNHFTGGQVNAYIQGMDSDGAVVFIGPNGNTIYPSSGGSSTPVAITEDIAIPLTSNGGTKTITLPITMTAGRIYFSEGELQFYMVATAIGDGVVQPVAQNIDGDNGDAHWGFVELTYTTDKAVYANISYVDFVGMLMSMTLKSTDGTSQTTKGLVSGSLDKICSELSAVGDGYPWSGSCITNSGGDLIRVLSPGNYEGIDSNHASAFSGLYTSYVSQVFSKYSSTPLTIATQDPTVGKVQCNVSGDSMTCGGGSSRAFGRPTSNDIFGCNSGPFGQDGANAVDLLIIPRLCAAFERSTLLLDGGNVQPSLAASKYYTVNPTNHYSKAIHDNEVDQRGYAFSYDDVHPDDGTDASGLVSTGTPDSLTIYVGGF